MNSKITYCASAVIATMFVAQPLFAQNAPRTSEPAGGAPPAATPAAQAAAAAGAEGLPGVKSMDKNQMFVEKAAQGGMYEVAAARLAQERAQEPQCKELAKMMEQDHQKANMQLMQIAQGKNLMVPKQLDTLHQAKLAELQKAQGADFDKMYMIDQTAGHVALSLKFRNASKELQDPELKQFATTTLQTINQHGKHVAKAVGWTGFDSNMAHPDGGHDKPAASDTATPATPRESGGAQPKPAGSGAGTGTGAGGTGGATSGQKNEDRGAVGPSSPGDATTPR